MHSTASRILLGSVCVILSACGRAPEAAQPASTEADAPAESAPGAYASPPPPAGQALPASPAPAEELAPKKGAESNDALRDDASELDTLEEAEAALARARAELETAWVGQSRARGEGSRAPAAAPAPARRAADKEEKAASGAKPQPPCVHACRAFASLERAAAAVCRLAGDGNERCSRARQVVADSRARITVCSCPSPDP